MENDNLILKDTSTEEETFNEVSLENTSEDEAFEISDEAKEQSRRFFKFGNKPKKEKRKFESFEIVKTFTPKEKKQKDDEFNKILEVSNGMQTVEDSVSVSSKTSPQKAQYKVRPQGKLVLIVIAIIIILLSSLTIHNAITLNQLNNDINTINNEITVQDLKIDKAVKNLQILNEEAISNEQILELELEKATETTEVELYERQVKPVPSKNSNWFDSLCDFISKIFGG